MWQLCTLYTGMPLVAQVVSHSGGELCPGCCEQLWRLMQKPSAVEDREGSAKILTINNQSWQVLLW